MRSDPDRVGAVFLAVLLLAALLDGVGAANTCPAAFPYMFTCAPIQNMGCYTKEAYAAACSGPSAAWCAFPAFIANANLAPQLAAGSGSVCAAAPASMPAPMPQPTTKAPVLRESFLERELGACPCALACAAGAAGGPLFRPPV